MTLERAAGHLQVRRRVVKGKHRLEGCARRDVHSLTELAIERTALYLTAMTTDLRAALRDEAMRFADRVHDLMIAQLASLLNPGSSPPVPPPPAQATVRREVTPAAPAQPTRQRLSQELIEEALAQIIRLLEKHPGGLRSEQIRNDLGMNKKLFQYAAHLGRTSDQLVQKGDRRTTTYSLPAKQSKAQEEGRVIRKKKR